MKEKSKSFIDFDILDIEMDKLRDYIFEKDLCKMELKLLLQTILEEIEYDSTSNSIIKELKEKKK